MTMPRELHCGHTREEAGRFKEYIMTEVKFPSEPTYYSQAVLDEKDARIKQLEEVLSFYGDYRNHMIDVNYSKVDLDGGELARQALAWKGGEE